MTDATQATRRQMIETGQPAADLAYLEQRDCAMISADLSLKAAGVIARWYDEHKHDG
jgi:hypothetical protein